MNAAKRNTANRQVMSGIASRLVRPLRPLRPWPSLLSLLPLLLLPLPLATGQAQGCDREGTTSFRFGLTGGNLMPSGTEITARGEIRQRSMERVGPVSGHVSPRAVRALAQRAWRGGFAALPPAPTRPTRNPDVARPYIELHSACGFHHVEYGPGDESPLFRDLHARLTRLARASRHRN